MLLQDINEIRHPTTPCNVVALSCRQAAPQTREQGACGCGQMSSVCVDSLLTGPAEVEEGAGPKSAVFSLPCNS